MQGEIGSKTNSSGSNDDDEIDFTKPSVIVPATTTQVDTSRGQSETEEILVRYMDPRKCPQIPGNINIENFDKYFKFLDFGHMYNIEVNIDSVSFTLNKGEEGLNVVKIPYRLFGPEFAGVRFPRFILSVSNFMSIKVDYISRKIYYNQNEILYLILRHRLEHFSKYKNAYTYLVTKDIQNLMNYADYNQYNSWNAIQKSLNSYAILEVYEENQYEVNRDGTTKYEVMTPIGENIFHPSFTHSTIANLFRDLKVLPGSESMASETGKFVVNETEEIYRAAGFKLDQINNNIKTIFPIKANIPARFKTHVIPDAFVAKNWDKPIFTEDLVPELKDGTDKTILNALCVFMPIQNDGRFLCGEIECSERFAVNQVVKREIVKDEFALVVCDAGDEVRNIGGKFILGLNQDGEEIALFGFDSVKVISVENIGLGGNVKIVAECIKKIGSSRIESSTGIKGVTKPRFHLGEIVVKNCFGQKTTMPVDILVGANSIKGKENTIYLAQAALAHQLGFHDQESISSLDEVLINKLKDSIGIAEYTDENGNKSEVYAGIVPIRVTEMAYMYKNAKLQSFMTQSGWYLHNNGYKDLSDMIYKDSVSEEDTKIIDELAKIIHDDRGVFVDNLPIYDLYQIEYVYDESDCKIDTNPIVKHVSKLLDPDFNKGFYLYMEHKKEYLRMPSADLINRFVSQIADGSWIYPRLMTVVSQILLTCIHKNSNDQINLGFIRRKNDLRTDKTIALANKYLDLCTGILHYKNNFIRNLMNPKVFGCSMKQMVDVNVPAGVMVIIDNNVHESLAKVTDGYLDKNTHFYALAIRNPVLWKSQIQTVKIWDWDSFESYLRLGTNVNVKDYINLRWCRDLVIMNPEDAIVQQSDVDGDLMPIFVPMGKEAQKILKRIHVNKPEDSFGGIQNITSQELDWIKTYRQSEFDSNSVFDKVSEKKYQLFNIPIRYEGAEKSFGKYFANSVVAKGDVGTGTSNLWALQILLDIYKYQTNKGLIKNSKGELVSFTDKDFHLISFVYTRLLQDLVVRGIKHVESGSSEFRPFLLANIIKRENRTITYKIISQNMKIGIEPTQKMFEILAWADANGYLKYISSFVSFYNSGAIEKYKASDEFKEVLKDIFYGSRLKRFFDILDQMKEAAASNYLRDPNDQYSSQVIISSENSDCSFNDDGDIVFNS